MITAPTASPAHLWWLLSLVTTPLAGGQAWTSFSVTVSMALLVTTQSLIARRFIAERERLADWRAMQSLSIVAGRMQNEMDLWTLMIAMTWIGGPAGAYCVIRADPARMAVTSASHRRTKVEASAMFAGMFLLGVMATDRLACMLRIINWVSGLAMGGRHGDNNLRNRRLCVDGRRHRRRRENGSRPSSVPAVGDPAARSEKRSPCPPRLLSRRDPRRERESTLVSAAAATIAEIATARPMS